MRCLFFVFALSTAILYSQPEKGMSEMKRIAEAFFMSDVSCSVKVEGYKLKNDKEGFVISKGTVKSSAGKGYYSSYAGEECISNSTNTFLVNHGSKQITVINKGFSRQKTPSQGAPDFKSLESNYDSATVKNLKDDRKKLTVYQGNSMISRFEFVYSSSYRLVSVTYFYSATAEEKTDIDHIVITYSYSDIPLTERDFSADQYVMKKGKAWTPKDKSYKVDLINY